LAYSDNNGDTWIGTTFSDRVNSINYGGAKWVASARGGNTLAYSDDDGITWTGLGNTIFSVSSNKAVWNGNIWIATGEGTNTLAKSTDGINWTGSGTVTFTTRANGIAWNETGNIWVATGESSDVSGNTLAYSTDDGTTWNGLGKSTFSKSGKGVIWGVDKWIATGEFESTDVSGNTLAYSTDGNIWNGLGNSIFTTRANDVAYNATSDIYVAVGEGTNTIAKSTNGIDWTGSGTVTFSSAGLAVTNSTSGGFIAVGAGGNAIAKSTDGTTWSGTGMALLDEAYGIGWNSSNRIIASIKISDTIGDFIYSDTSGNTIWNLSNQPSVFSDHANDTAYNGTIWVGTGQGNGNTLAYSQNNAITWIGLGKTVFSISSNKVAWNGSMWIATGEGTNTLAKSTDGINWTGLGAVTFTTRANGIAWDNINNTWVATGESTDVSGNTLAYSTDNGTTWTGLGKSVFSTGGTSAFWNGYIWVATGEGANTIAMSYNGIDWTGKGNAIISNKANDVVWHDIKSTWVVVGEGGNTIATSYDGNTWTGRGKTTFTTKGSAVTLDGSGNFVAVGEGDNTIATSSDGNTWIKQETSIDFLIPRYGIGWDTKTIGENQAFYDVSNSWVDNLKLEKSSYVLSDPEYNINGENWSSITGTGVLESDTIDITNTDNMNGITITPLPNTEGLTTSNNSNTLYLRLPPGTYTREQLITEINNQFQNTTITNGGQAIASDSLISVIDENNVEFIKIALDINKTYNSSDSKIVFYDPYSFVHSCAGLNNTTNTSWDSTLGWILGYHEATEYDLSVNLSITGDNVVSVNIYNYFMILLDDYNNNHMNDGVVTTTKAETDFKLPSYVNRALSTIDPITGNVTVSGISTNGTQMTQNQLYASQAVVDQNKSTLSAIKYSSGPFAKNVFGLIPMDISNQVNNTVYIDYGTSLQDQERSYFGPVNIQRMSVKLINDKGEIVNLNGADWSFSFICEQLYQNNRV
jgi:sucrose-6-phosphate hydrolase SacC (GH32 family)